MQPAQPFRIKTLPDGSMAFVDENDQIQAPIARNQVIPSASQKSAIAEAFGKYDPRNAINTVGETPFAPPPPPPGTVAPQTPQAPQAAVKPKAPAEAPVGTQTGMPVLPNLTQTVTSSTLGKDTRELNKAYQALDQTLQRVGQAEGRLAREQGAADLATQKEIAELNQDVTDTLELGQGAVAEKQAAFDAAAKEQAGYLFDQNRFYKRMTTGNQILAGLGVILGGLASGFDGKENKALKVLNDAIDKDIAQQRMEYEKLKDKTGAAQTGYSMARQMAGDEKEAAKLTRDLAVENTVNQAKAMFTQRFGPERAELEAEKLRAKLSVDKEAAKLGAQGSTTVQKTSDPLAALRMGQGDQTALKDQKKTLEEVEQRRQNIGRNLTDLKSMVKKYGTQELTGSYKTEVERLINDIAVDKAKLLDPTSVAREGEVELAKKGLFSPGFFQRESTALKSIESFEKDINNRGDEFYVIRGLKPPARADTTPKGKQLTGG